MLLLQDTMEGGVSMGFSDWKAKTDGEKDSTHDESWWYEDDDDEMGGMRGEETRRRRARWVGI